MKKSLLISAAALIAASSLTIAQAAVAQGMPSRDAPSAQPSAPAAPAEKITPPATTGQSQPKSIPESAQVPIGSSRAQDFRAQDMNKETTGQGSRDSAPAARDTSPPARDPVRDVTPSPDRKSQTTGQGAAGTSSSLSGEQRSKISATIKQQNAPRLANVNFTLSIGTAIPRDVRRMPLPATVIQVYPVWRGYDYVLVGDEILVIDPATLRIVAIIEA